MEMKRMEGKISFESFMPGTGGDLFAKIKGLAAHLGTHVEPCLEALGHELLTAAGPQTTVRDLHGRQRRVVMMGSNSFLNLAMHPQVTAAAKAAVDRFGYGMGAVPVYAGTTDLHRELEQAIARFLHREDAILFPCGYSGNVGLISALCGPGDVILNDAANHASIFDGGQLSGADLQIYLHGNMRHLAKQLRRLPEGQQGRLIVTDGVFSMDGDLAPLAEICDLAEQYGARVMVDDAHGIGVVGPSGRGTPEACGCLERVDVLYGTLSKAPAGIGGYCAGSAALIRYLRLYARTFFFSTSLPAPVVAGLLEVFKLLEADQAGRRQLWVNIEYLKAGLAQQGLDTGHSASAIVPVMVRDEVKLGRLHAALLEEGVFTNIVSYPAVRRKDCRLRLNVMANHTPTDLDHVIATLGTLGRELGIVVGGGE